MINYILNKIVGDQNEREIKRLKPVIAKISSLEPEICRLSDGELKAKTDEFRRRIREGLAGLPVSRLSEEDDEETKKEKKAQLEEYTKAERDILNEILPEAFAVVREAGKRFVNMRHFDVQLMGGIVLHEGKISEMATGEGKTLVATLAVYLNSLAGRGVHVVTVNDYLARRDREWMGPIYESLGLTVGAIQHDMNDTERQAAYGCDITYGTNNEFGFDYLRDNMKFRKQDLVQREYNFAVVDEVDSILVDEARTPLIISGPSEESTELYYKIDKIVPRLQKDTDYQVEEKTQTVALTEDGIKKAEGLLGVGNLYESVNMEIVHHINQALRAHNLFKRDVDYMIKDGEVVIVDEFTGRLMPGRRWSDGLHQAIEAKENVKIERENQTLATITFQNYFRMYRKLSGMTGTAATEAAEFHAIYKLEVVTIPTNRSLIRTNHPDVIYRTEKEKFDAVVAEIEELNKKGRPVLVGTISIEKSEHLSSYLKRRKIPHQVLNAKYHEMEAHIVAQAGRFGAVTIATNMAGRGTDILLGGNAEFLTNDLIKQRGLDPAAIDPKEKEEVLQKAKAQVEDEHKKVVELGGLHVLGTERHEARRIDNQLRGRSGRQGDPGSSRFYIALEDDLMRIFGSDRISVIMQKLGMEEGQAIEHPLVSRSIEIAQKRVEAHNFDIRKHLLEYDNVMNKQREVIYEERRRVLEGRDSKSHIFDMIDEVLNDALNVYMSDNADASEWDYKGLAEWARSKFPVSAKDIIEKQPLKDELMELLSGRIKGVYEAKEQSVGPELMRELERIVLLQIIDAKWKDHLYAMDNLREGIGLRAYGQRDPLVEYQHEGYEMFTQMISHIKEEAVEFVFRVQIAHAQEARGVFEAVPQEYVHPEARRFEPPPPRQQPQVRQPVGDEESEFAEAEGERLEPYHREAPKVGRNDPCPCGSGKKYKKCCGK